MVAGAPVLRDGTLVGAVRVDFKHEEVVGSARRWPGALPRWRASGSSSARS
jgi:hypothetical protein